MSRAPATRAENFAGTAGGPPPSQGEEAGEGQTHARHGAGAVTTGLAPRIADVAVAVEVGVGLVDVLDQDAAVALVAGPVAVGVELVLGVEVRAGVARVAHPIEVAVDLRRVVLGVAVVTGVADQVAVEVRLV